MKKRGEKMFNFFKHKIDNNIYAPVDGKCIDITEVHDATFASKMMGDGVAIVPASNIIKAPCNGTLSTVFHTGHAFGMLADNGAEILIHIGIETVNLNGKGFKALKGEGDKVKKGEPIVEIDLEEIKRDYDPSTMLIITNQKPIQKRKVSDYVEGGEVIIEVN